MSSCMPGKTTTTAERAFKFYFPRLNNLDFLFPLILSYILLHFFFLFKTRISNFDNQNILVNYTMASYFDLVFVCLV